MKTTNHTGRKRRESGQAVVEFAIIAPVLLLLLLGMLEWGFLLWTQTTFENAVREGSRAAVVIRDWGVDTATKQSTVKAVVISRVSALPVSITSGIDADITVDLLPGTANLSSIKVTILNHPYTPVLGLASFLTPATLTAAAEFRYEGGM